MDSVDMRWAAPRCQHSAGLRRPEPPHAKQGARVAVCSSQKNVAPNGGKVHPKPGTNSKETKNQPGPLFLFAPFSAASSCWCHKE